MPVPKFVSSLMAADVSDEDRIARLQQEHSAHAAHKYSWQVQLDAFEDDGGFLTGNYLWPYPREEDRSFNERKHQARYHNYLESLVDLYVRYLFTQDVKRTSKNQEYNDWQADVDGVGTSMSDYMRQLAAMSLVNGHAGALVDKTADQPLGPTKAEEQGRVVLATFPATTIIDWRFKENRLVEVKLREPGPQPSITEKRDPQTDYCQYLLWGDDGWARFDDKGHLVSSDMPGLDLVPLVILRPKASHVSQMLGRALVSNANVLQALYNRCSEEDEVLRAQAFSVLTVEVPSDGDVDAVRAALGGSVGVAKALIVKGSIKYETPSQEVPAAIRANIQFLTRELYRAAHVRYQDQSLARETADSIRLEYTELNEMLQGFAKSLAAAEKMIARAWFAWQTPDPAQAEAAYEAAQVEAQYPDEFFLDDLATELTAWAQGISMGLGDTMTRRIKKRAARRIEPMMPQEDLDQVDAEIDAMKPEELNPMQALQAANIENARNPPDTGSGPNDGPPGRA